MELCQVLSCASEISKRRALYKVRTDGLCLYFSFAAPTGTATSSSFSADASPE